MTPASLMTSRTMAAEYLGPRYPFIVQNPPFHLVWLLQVGNNIGQLTKPQNQQGFNDAWVLLAVYLTGANLPQYAFSRRMLANFGMAPMDGIIQALELQVCIWSLHGIIAYWLLCSSQQPTSELDQHSKTDVEGYLFHCVLNTIM